MSAAVSGRGPTALISPRRMLTNCGSSSSPVARRTRPRAELENAKRPPATSDALLAKDDESAVVQPYQQGDRRNCRRKDQEACDGTGNVEDALGS